MLSYLPVCFNCASYFKLTSIQGHIIFFCYIFISNRGTIMYLKCKTALQIVIITCVYKICDARSLYERFNDPAKATITKMNVDPWSPREYLFEYETSNGIRRKEHGFLKDNAEGKNTLMSVGMYSYVGPNNVLYRVNYKADETGYHPSVHEITLSKSNGNAKSFQDSPTDIDELYNLVFPDDKDSPSTETSFKDSSDFITDNPFADDETNTTTPNTTVPGEEELGLGDRFGIPPAVIGSLLG